MALKKKLKKHHDNEKVGVQVKVEKSKRGKENEVLKDKNRLVSEPDANTPANMLKEGRAIVGLSKGVKLNMGNYQSATINCWITRNCDDNDMAVQKELANISDLLDEQIEYEKEQLEVEE